MSAVDGHGRPARVVALGGGHGLGASLRALRRLDADLTAVVTVADDGGSSGRLRKELGALPPGDLRMALTALAGDDDWSRTWERLLQHRFPGEGGLGGHAVGNLLITGLTQITGDPLEALDLVGRLLGVRGRVLPLCREPLDIAADVAGLDPADPAAVREVRGQVSVATTTGHVVGVRLLPERPRPCPDAVAALARADAVVLGPGSWFTSVLPHLLVPEVAEALACTPARRIVTLNLAPQPGETEGFAPETHLEVLVAHVPGLRVDVVVADPRAVPHPDALEESARAIGAELVLAPVGCADGSPVHDPQALAAALGAVIHPRGWPPPASPDRPVRDQE